MKVDVLKSNTKSGSAAFRSRVRDYNVLVEDLNETVRAKARAEARNRSKSILPGVNSWRGNGLTF